MQLEQRSLMVKHLAMAKGFDFCGISKAGFLEEEAPRLESWLKSGQQGAMTYMERFFDKRLDPRKLVAGAKSIITLLYNYYPAESPATTDNFHIAKYAYGRDYHFVIKRKLKDLFAAIKEEMGAVEGRVFVDSAPVMERAWAQRAGLGWIGKNSLLLNRKMGSYFFIAQLITDLELQADAPGGDYCGTCTRCVDSCPTEAITPYQVDASKCISYLTIELKEAIPEQFGGTFENWIFGCDICQDVCPWNRFAEPHREPQFVPLTELLEMDQRQWRELSEEQFQKIFKESALKRTGFSGLKRNIEFAGRVKKEPRP